MGVAGRVAERPRLLNGATISGGIEQAPPLGGPRDLRTAQPARNSRQAMLTVKSPRRCTNSLVPSSRSTIRKVLACWPWSGGLFFSHQRDIGKFGPQPGRRDQRVCGYNPPRSRAGVRFWTTHKILSAINLHDLVASFQRELPHDGGELVEIHVALRTFTIHSPNLACLIVQETFSPLRSALGFRASRTRHGSQPISEGQLFQQRRTTSLFQAALTAIALIYHMTVYKLPQGRTRSSGC